jgi:hypothetical protein
MHSYTHACMDAPPQGRQRFVETFSKISVHRRQNIGSSPTKICRDFFQNIGSSIRRAGKDRPKATSIGEARMFDIDPGRVPAESQAQRCIPVNQKFAKRFSGNFFNSAV